MKYDYEHMSLMEIEDLYDRVFDGPAYIIGAPFPELTREGYRADLISCIERGEPQDCDAFRERMTKAYSTLPKGAVV